ncbi:MAG: Flp pilus assembly complex ATPase component TadA [Candidatus Omnitrophica bacterium]|nr:Flp pilus assembly complex ATPase component TadA [Candidatus Omnitrophota bacterium]
MALYQKQKTLTDILEEEGLLNKKQIEELTEETLRKKRKKGELFKTLVQKYGLKEEDLAYSLAKQFGCPYFDLKKHKEKPEAELLKKIPKSWAKRHLALPLKVENNELTITMADPTNILVLDELAVRTGMKIQKVVSTSSDILEAIETFYLGKSAVDIGEVMEEIDARYLQVEKIEIEDKDVTEESAPIVKLVNSFIAEARKRGASDVHIEPTETGMIVRYRIDGILKDIYNIPKHAQNALISRVKIMTDLDIAEHRRPQDGRINFKKYGNLDIDLRVGISPMLYGEKIVMRILDKAVSIMNLDRMGFSQDNLERYRAMIHKPYGMILHVGPTGSGKTTTLYSALSEINSRDVNIQTAEDPVEYTLSGINQLQVRSNIGVTFASALRSFLRQDPDIIMVGEIRDFETAQIAVEAALTGHLVFSTLHTNDAAGTVVRLLDMGIEPFLAASSILCVVAQRLVRRICESCKVSYLATKEELAGLGLTIKEDKIKLYKGKGCPDCDGTGYKGRLGIHEVLTMNEELKNLILKRASSDEIKEEAMRSGMKSLYEDALVKMASGITTPQEVMRVTMEAV